MQTFINDNFLLSTPTAQRLYHDYAADLPIIDYHNHLPPQQIADYHFFNNISQAWLYGDHYKWRAMRTNGVAEKYCTGDASDLEKFQQWSATVPYTVRNPLYHWTHLELLRYFGIKELLNPETASSIYNTCNEQLQQASHNTVGLLSQQNVKLLCTTDDPLDSLEHHARIKLLGCPIVVLPAFRPDKAMAVNDAASFIQYVRTLEVRTDLTIRSLDDYLEALLQRHDFFASMGCTVSDHGLEQMYAEQYTHQEVSSIFEQVMAGHALQEKDVAKFKSALLYQFAVWGYQKGWVQQYHLGALRSVNSRQLTKLGGDTGWDSIGDFPQAVSCAKFLNRLDAEDKLAKTILYNLNPADNEVMATMIGNFNDGSIAGKVQWGSAWWFLDQKDGMTRQINTLSNMGLISRFVGMITDSRSFLSFPRHEYFRRILCNLFGSEVESGELPADERLLGSIISNICYHNALNYFNWQQQFAPATIVS